MSAPAQQVRVLIVEDDREDYELACEIFSEIRSSVHYELEHAPSYDRGLAALRERRFDVCLLDYRLGPRDGFELLTEAQRCGMAVPIIVLTGRGDQELEARLLAAGAADYLIKGRIDAEALERSIRHSVERSRSIEALRERERQFRSVFEAAHDAMLIADDTGRFIDANQAALALLGISRERLLSMSSGDLAPVEPALAARSCGPRLSHVPHHGGEFCLRRPDGSERIIELRANVSCAPGRFLSVLQDVTERCKAEEQRRRLASIVESAADAIKGVTLDGIIEYWSPAAERVYGYAAQEVIGQSMRMLAPEQVHPQLSELLARGARGEVIRDLETTRRRKDGSLFAASHSVWPLRERDRVVALSVITRDISEKKKLEAHLAVSDHMASVGTLAAGIAHEINNPLTALIGNLDFLTWHSDDLGIGPDDELRQALRDARLSADRIRQVARDLRLFSRPDEERRGPVELQRVLESSLRMAWNEIRHRARLVRDYADVPPVLGNDARLGQVFLNLIINATQAIREGEAEQNEICVRTRSGGPGWVIVEVADTGTGISAEVWPHLFEPFFTTKPAGIGTGLGLSICRRIVHDLGGQITVEGAAGSGTTFRVVLPAAVGLVEHSLPPAAPPLARAQERGRVLVIDDEPLIGNVVERALAHHHDITTVSSAAAALEQLKRGARFDVILCDMMMPQMTGMDFYHALAAFAPAEVKRVVFVTGGSFTPASREFLERVENPCVEKPFDGTHLREVIGTRLASARAR